ncbi:MAG: hypothetical protein LC679_17835 [Intrasporangiaceae bacterium]|nr:hypothetical protein [Intrasporangiaceae bacterium]
MITTLSPGDYAMRSAAAYRRQLLEHLTAHGVPEVDPEAAGRHAAAVTAAGQAWADDAGPFTDTAGARVALGGVSKQAVSQRLRELTAADDALGGQAPVDLLEAGHRDRVLAVAAEVRESLGVEERAAAVAADARL